ncbi:hypothetical protein QCA50_019294 [Cerrena zonata]|uniref:Uncharacterized protein n=1 Tax=Cerrena zonata TaxID=2478898 RepID=A0AAW0FKF7_9APHY
MIAPYTVILASLLTVMTVVQGVTAESHTVTFTNNCDNGTPTLIDSRGNVLSTGGDFTSDGPLIAIAFLQTDSCGEDCALIETTLQNPPAPESFGSITDISLVPPYVTGSLLLLVSNILTDVMARARIAMTRTARRRSMIQMTYMPKFSARRMMSG